MKIRQTTTKFRYVQIPATFKVNVAQPKPYRRFKDVSIADGETKLDMGMNASTT